MADKAVPLEMPCPAASVRCWSWLVLCAAAGAEALVAPAAHRRRRAMALHVP